MSEELDRIKGRAFTRPMRIDDELEAAKNSEYARWFRCLKMSDVYSEYARRRTSGASEDRVQVEPKIAETFKLFGDVRRLDFETWWQTRGRQLFKISQPLKRVREIAEEAELDRLALTDNKLVLEIPLTLTRQTVMRQISKLLAERYAIRPPVDIYQEAPTRAKRIHNKIRMDHVDKALDILQALKVHGDKTLAEIGVLTDLNLKLGSIKPDDIYIENTMNDPEFRRRMTLAVARYATNAENLVDNAIRGEFPSLKRVEKSRVANRKLRRY
jgi:hypothetical protein